MRMRYAVPSRDRFDAVITIGGRPHTGTVTA